MHKIRHVARIDLDVWFWRSETHKPVPERRPCFRPRSLLYEYLPATLVRYLEQDFTGILHRTAFA